MEKEKRKVGDYTVLCSVNIGSREIILAENEQSTNGERFLCCYGERDDIFEKFTECAVGDDYPVPAHERTSAAQATAHAKCRKCRKCQKGLYLCGVALYNRLRWKIVERLCCRAICLSGRAPMIDRPHS